MTNIIIFPQAKNSTDRLKILREKLQALILEHDHLLYQECKNLKVRYLLEFGALEYRYIELSMKEDRLKRKLDLLNIKINRDEKITKEYLLEIEKYLDEKLSSFKERLNQQAKDLDWAIDWAEKPLMNPNEMLEFKSKYRDLVKKLHPDLNKDLSESDLDLYYKVVDAYKNGQIDLIRLYHDLIIGKEETDLKDEKLIAYEIQRISENIEKLEKSIEKIKDSFPYDKKDLLEDEKEIENEKEAIKNVIKALLKNIEYLEKRIEEITKNVWYRKNWQGKLHRYFSQGWRNRWIQALRRRYFSFWYLRCRDKLYRKYGKSPRKNRNRY